jgi:hypothetical protein
MTSSSRGPSRAAAFFGLLAVLAVPAGVVASRYVQNLTLLRGLYVAVPVAFVLGLIAWACSRKARYAAGRRVLLGAQGPVRLGRFLALAGLYVAVTGAIALAFYGVLQHAQ